jgi:hypothetical protein
VIDPLLNDEAGNSVIMVTQGMMAAIRSSILPRHHCRYGGRHVCFKLVTPCYRATLDPPHLAEITAAPCSSITTF